MDKNLEQKTEVVVIKEKEKFWTEQRKAGVKKGLKTLGFIFAEGAALALGGIAIKCAANQVSKMINTNREVTLKVDLGGVEDVEEF